ncbi:MAG: NAD(+) synthase [Kiritimatiellae bacterium]|nr:NAD(+) synthase [Kiritimatiellia bacterium]
MKVDGTLRVRLVQMEVRAGRPRDNAARMISHLRRAAADGVELVVFPEMAIPGYLVGDEWEREAFLRECETCAEKVRMASRGIVAVFGSVGLDPKRRNEDGRIRKYNALFVADNGEFRSPAGSSYPFVIKTLLPHYREFDETRHFYDLRKLALDENLSIAELLRPVVVRGFSLGCVICEDAWDTDYTIKPLALLARHNPDLYIVINASPFTVGKDARRHRMLSKKAAELGRPLIYVNCVGIQNTGKNVFTFDGGSCIYDSTGKQVPCGAPFEEGSLTFDVPLKPGANFAGMSASSSSDIALIYRAIQYGTRKFMELCGVERVVVGVSGGIDSAVVATLYSTIVQKGNLLAVTMPGPFTSSTTLALARTLVRNLDCLLAEVPINETFCLTKAQLDGLVVTNPSGSHSHRLALSERVLENVQARDRASRILAAVAAAFGGVFTCNANKSEATVGYTTLYGDLTGYLANLADLWKTEVYELARHLNAEVFRADVIPPGIFELTPSAELSPAQNVDERKGDPLVYPYHDRLFASWVEWWNRASPEEILGWYMEGVLEERLGYAGKLSTLFPTPESFVTDLERWWESYQGLGLAKRIQAPPILAVKRRAFGSDLRESQLGVLYSHRYRELKKQLLERAGSGVI